MKFPHAPYYYAAIPGPYGVDCAPHKGRHVWCVVHRGTLRAKVVGVVGGRRKNFYDVAMEEASKRNFALQEKKS